MTTLAKSITHDPKWCAHCFTKRPSVGGAYVPINKMRQQWFCARCLGLLNQKEEGK